MFLKNAQLESKKFKKATKFIRLHLNFNQLSLVLRKK